MFQRLTVGFPAFSKKEVVSTRCTNAMAKIYQYVGNKLARGEITHGGKICDKGVFHAAFPEGDQTFLKRGNLVMGLGQEIFGRGSGKGKHATDRAGGVLLT